MQKSLQRCHTLDPPTRRPLAIIKETDATCDEVLRVRVADLLVWVHGLGPRDVERALKGVAEVDGELVNDPDQVVSLRRGSDSFALGLHVTVINKHLNLLQRMAEVELG